MSLRPRIYGLLQPGCALGFDDEQPEVAESNPEWYNTYHESQEETPGLVFTGGMVTELQIVQAAAPQNRSYSQGGLNIADVENMMHRIGGRRWVENFDRAVLMFSEASMTTQPGAIRPEGGTISGWLRLQLRRHLIAVIDECAYRPNSRFERGYDGRWQPLINTYYDDGE